MIWKMVFFEDLECGLLWRSGILKHGLQNLEHGLSEDLEHVLLWGSGIWNIVFRIWNVIFSGYLECGLLWASGIWSSLRIWNVIFSHFSWFCEWLMISQIHQGVSKSTRMLSPFLNLRKYLANPPIHSFRELSSLVCPQRTLASTCCSFCLWSWRDNTPSPTWSSGVVKCFDFCVPSIPVNCWQTRVGLGVAGEQQTWSSWVSPKFQ